MLLFFAIGCAHYEVMVSSINNNETAGNKVFVAPGMKDVAINDLQFQEFSNYIKKVLIKKGFAIVNTIDEADQVVMLVYAISGPQNYTANVPLWGPTGIESSTTYGNISSSGSNVHYYGSTYYNKTYGITGYVPVQETYYIRTIILTAYDWQLFKKKENIPPDFDLSLRMSKGLWVHKGVRPANFPERRIINISEFFAETTFCGIYDYFKEKIRISTKNYLDANSSKKIVEHVMSFKGVGITRKREMFFNIILPFFLAHLAIADDIKIFLKNLIVIHPSLEENGAIKKFHCVIKKEFKITDFKFKNVKEYFGALEYVANLRSV